MIRSARRAIWQTGVRRLGAVCIWLMLAACASSAAFTWKNVRIGGGGYITGLIIHPLHGSLMYARTDVGGAYRWDAGAASWTPITDWIPYTSANLYGIESIALDPSDTNIVYIACGERMDSSPHGVYKSVNRGATWAGPYLTSVPMGANDTIIGGRASPFLRNAGERLMVDPNDGRILYFGSRSDGLWKSYNAGNTWTKQTIPNAGKAGYGISFVAFDPTSSSRGSPCTRVYYGAFGTNASGTDGGIYKSNNAGTNWAKLNGSANQPRRGMVSVVDGRLWVTHQVGVVTATSTSATLTDATPSQAPGVCYNALAIDPSDASKAVAIRGEMNSNATIYKTANGGASWSQVSSGTHAPSVPWWKNKSWFWAAQVSACAINPSSPGQLWYGDWYGVWKTDNYGAGSPIWNTFVSGHEETVTFTLIAPPAPSVDLLSGCADMEGFRHNNGPDNYPTYDVGSAPGNGPKCDFQATFGLAYCETDPTFFVRGAGSQTTASHGVCVSTDNGASWRSAPGWTSTDMPRRVAISATDTNVFLVTVSSGKPRRTGNGGQTFTTCNGIAENGPAGPWERAQLLCADKVDGNVFYYYVSGKLYRSADGGQNFTAVKTGLPTSSRVNLRSVPGVKGDIWLSLDGNGLWRSTTGGTNFAEIRSPAGARITARAFGFGKPASGTVPWLYLFGTLDGSAGMFLSKDRGSTWVRISNTEQAMGDGPDIVEPSRQVVGRVYLGTGGRGIFQGNAPVVLPDSVSIQGTLTNGAFEVSATVPQGQLCILQASTNMIHWLAVATNTASNSGNVSLTNETGHPLRFYRMSFP